MYAVKERRNPHLVNLLFYIFLSVVGLCLVFIGAVWRETLPLSYFAGYFFVGVSIVVSVKYNMNRSSLLSILILGCLLRIFPLVGSSKVLWGDVVHDYLLMEIYNEKGYISTLPDLYAFGQYHTTFTKWVYAYSSYPLVHTLGVIIHRLTTIPLFQLSTTLQVIFFIVQALIIYSITYNLFKDYNISSFAVFMFAIYPDLIYWGAQVGRMNMALTFLMMIVYCLIKLQSSNVKTTFQVQLIIVLLSLAIVVSHHLTTVVLIHMLIISYLLIILNYMLEKYYMNVANTNILKFLYKNIIYILIILISFEFIFFVMYNTNTTNFWSRVARHYIDMFLLLLKGSPKLEYTPLDPTATNLSLQLRMIPYLRDTIISILAVYGLLHVTKRYLAKSLLILSIFISLIILIFLGIFKVVPVVQRYITYIGIIVSIFSASTMHMISIKKRKFLILLIICLVLLSSSALWGHRKIPMNIYGISNDPEYNYNLMDLEKPKNGIDWLSTMSHRQHSYYLGLNAVTDLSILYYYHKYIPFKKVISIKDYKTNPRFAMYDIYALYITQTKIIKDFNPTTYCPLVNAKIKFKGAKIYDDQILWIYYLNAGKWYGT